MPDITGRSAIFRVFANEHNDRVPYACLRALADRTPHHAKIQKMLQQNVIPAAERQAIDHTGAALLGALQPDSQL